MMRHLNCALLTGLLAFWIFTGCATTQPVGTSGLPFIDLAAISSEADRFQQLLAEFEAGELSETLIRIPAGMALPVNLSIDTPMAHMESTCSQLHVDRELWFHVNGSRLKVSPDGQRWIKLSDKETLRKVFGYEEGSFSINLEATEEEGAGLHLSLHANPRVLQDKTQ